VISGFVIARVLRESASPDARRVIIAKGLRAVADGYVSIVLPAYLLMLGRSPLEIGALMTATLLGSALLTIFAGVITGYFGERRPLIAASILMIATGIGFSGLTEFWPLLVVAFVGTLNPSSGDVSIFLPLEQSLLARSVGDRDRTLLFALYSISASLMGAIGTLLAGTPDFANRIGMDRLTAMRGLFWLYAAIGVVAALLYSGVSETHGVESQKQASRLGPSRMMVYRLTALFCVDSFGGGFLVQSILALWLFEAFHLPVSTASSIFFWTNILTTVSYFAAVPISRRFGLVNTMVFTHLPANICLLLIPFMPKLAWVIALLLLRSLLSQMDVPTRTSYVMAVVTPAERPAAASLTAVPRSLASAISPVLAGSLLAFSSFGWPLLIGGSLKAVYDLTLLAAFRHIRPPEERVVETEPK
jgi:MFS family permease